MQYPIVIQTAEAAVTHSASGINKDIVPVIIKIVKMTVTLFSILFHRTYQDAEYTKSFVWFSNFLATDFGFAVLYLVVFFSLKF